MIFNRVIAGTAIAVAVVVFSPHYVCAQNERELGILAEEEHAAAAGTKELIDEAAGELEGKHTARDEHGAADNNPLEFKADLAIWTAVVFIVLLLVLWRFAWGPIAAGLDKREQAVAGQIDQAELANHQAKELLAQYEQKLSDAKDEVNGIIEQGRREAEKVGREMIDKSRDEAAAEQQRAVQQIETAATAALEELAEKGADMAVDLAGKIVRAELKSADHARLIDWAVANFADQPPSNN